MIKIAADDDVVIGPAFNRFGQVGFPRDRGDEKLLEVLARQFLDRLFAFEELLHCDRNPRLVGSMSVKRVHQPGHPADAAFRSEEHTSELQSQSNLVCRLLLEKKK